MILVLGGTGILGSALVSKLLEDNLPIRVNFRSDSRKKKLTDFLKNQGLETKITLIDWVQADILDKESLNYAMSDISKVYHCANFVSFNERDRKKLLEINHIGTQNVVDACLENGVEEILYVSSIATLDAKAGSETVDEDCHWDLAKNHGSYEVSKYLGELEIWRGVEEGMKAIVVKPGIVLSNYDFNQSSGRLFKTYAGRFAFYTSGSTGFVDVRDVAVRMKYLMENNYFNQSYIIVAQNLDFKKISEILRKAYKKSRPIGISNKTLRAFKVIYNLISAILPFIQEYSEAFWKNLTTETKYSSAKINSVCQENYKNIEQSLNQYAKDYMNNE